VILDGAEIARQSFTGLDGSDPRAALLAFYPQTSIPPLDHVVLTAEPLVARVNRGIWIASCSCGARGLPAPGTVVFLDVLIGWCVRCGNKPWDGGWRPITAPPEAERHQIEAVLLCRPNVGDRNWEPGERVADLLAQNATHGDPIPDRLAEALIGPLHGPTWRETVTPFSPAPRRKLGPRWWQKLLGRR
jgi:hypothetical protein